MYDLQLTKDLGFNMLRKHTKVESDRWCASATQSPFHVQAVTCSEVSNSVQKRDQPSMTRICHPGHLSS